MTKRTRYPRFAEWAVGLKATKTGPSGGVGRVYGIIAPGIGFGAAAGSWNSGALHDVTGSVLENAGLLQQCCDLVVTHRFGKRCCRLPPLVALSWIGTGIEEELDGLLMARVCGNHQSSHANAIPGVDLGATREEQPNDAMADRPCSPRPELARLAIGSPPPTPGCSRDTASARRSGLAT